MASLAYEMQGGFFVSNLLKSRSASDRLPFLDILAHRCLQSFPSSISALDSFTNLVRLSASWAADYLILVFLSPAKSTRVMLPGVNIVRMCVGPEEKQLNR